MAVNTLVVMEIFDLFSVRYVHGTSLTWQGTRAVIVEAEKRIAALVSAEESLLIQVSNTARY
jgi:hypothetical protein